jgi:hypothetical protein
MALMIANKDLTIINEIMNKRDSDNVENPKEILKIVFQEIKKFKNIVNVIRVIKGIVVCFAIPTLVISIKKDLDDEAILTRAVTYSAPILLDFGINILALLAYTSIILMLIFKPFRNAAKYVTVMGFFGSLCPLGIIYSLFNLCLRRQT